MQASQVRTPARPEPAGPPARPSAPAAPAKAAANRRDYRGRRRLPKLPSRRYARVVLSAFLGALLVVAGSASFGESSDSGTDTSVAAAMDLLSNLDRDSRGELGRGPARVVDMAAPDVWTLPVTTYTFTSSYGWRRHPGTGAWNPHNGVDLAAPYWTPIYAARAGLVVEAQWNDGGYGYFVRIDHGDGVLTLYGHIAPLGIVVQAGQRVRAGELIAHVGNTGDSYGNHLHFEVRINGVPTNPVTYLRPYGVDLLRGTDSVSGTNG